MRTIVVCHGPGHSLPSPHHLSRAALVMEVVVVGGEVRRRGMGKGRVSDVAVDSLHRSLQEQFLPQPQPPQALHLQLPQAHQPDL